MKKITKKTFSLLIVFILLLTLTISPSAQSLYNIQSAEPLHYMGALPDTQENINRHLLAESTANTRSLPSYVDNSYLYPTPMKQTQPDCVAWAIGYAQMAGMQALNRNWTINTSAHKFSPAFLYNISNNGVNDGIILGTGMFYAVRYGVCPITYYAINNPYNASVPSLAYEAALLYKPSSYSVTSSISQIKQFIADGKGVVIGIWVHPEMYFNMSASNPIYDDDSGEQIDGHAICLVGYDDSKQAFKFINSWGNTWCENGFGWITYNFVASDDINMNGACHGYVMEFSSTDNYVMGDANLDNVVTAADSRLALRFSSSVETPTDRQYVLSDVDGDGTVTATDARNILNYASGTLTKFPLYE